jgi:hypothetical protein
MNRIRIHLKEMPAIFMLLWLLPVLGIINVSCTGKEDMPRAQHVVIFGLDGVGARALQLAETPGFNRMIAGGAISVKTRTVLPSNSGPTWVSMLTGTIPEHHGVRTNSWNTGNYSIEPAIKTADGYFPSVFNHISEQRPEMKAFMFYEWGSMINLFDENAPDGVIHRKDGEELFNAAYELFFREKPEFMFVAIDSPDGYGHKYGYDHPEYFRCISKFDSLIGTFTRRLEEENMLKNTVIIITSDHGGIGKGHGGDSPNEMEIPVLLYGGPVTAGKIISRVHLITDVAATAAGLLGIKLPEICTGRFISEAFEPPCSSAYIPIPSVRPSPLAATRTVTVRKAEDNTDRELSYSVPAGETIELVMSSDFSGTEVYYTFDPSTPDSLWIRYPGPVRVRPSDIIWAVTVSGENRSARERVAFSVD